MRSPKWIAKEKDYTFMSRNKQSRKYLINCRSYENDEFDWPFLFDDSIIIS